MFKCPGCHEVDPKPTPAQHCRACAKYQEWFALEACAPIKLLIERQPRSDGLCPDCGEKPKQDKCGYCKECRAARDRARTKGLVIRKKWVNGFCADCGAPEWRKAANGGCLSCRARGRRQEYEQTRLAQGKMVKKMKRRVPELSQTYPK